MGTIIQGLFAEHFQAYCASHTPPRAHRRAAVAIQRCRTPAMGTHIAVCEAGHIEGLRYNSCRHRACPQCNAALKSAWLEKTLATLLPCGHFHLIFTIPSELHPLWQYNRRRVDALLFECSAAALRVLTRDERHLGAEVGMLSTLHTWGRSLSVHPHIHMLVTAGGLDQAGTWRGDKRGYLIPVRALMALFRGKLLAALRAALEAEALQLPPDRSPAQIKSLLNRLGRVKWNVHIGQRYDHGEGVLKYLARYVRGGPLRPDQVRRSDQAVQLHYQDHRQGRRCLSLSPQAFLARLLTHVPCPGLHTLRRYGLYAHCRGRDRERAREQLVPGPARDAPREPRTTPFLPVHRCAQCGAPMRYQRVHQVARAPPPADQPSILLRAA